MLFSRKITHLLAATLIIYVSANLPSYYWQISQSVRAQTEPQTVNPETDILLQKGVVQAESGSLTEAVDTFQQALALSRYDRDRDRQELALTNLAIVYRQLEQPARSIQFYQQAYSIHRNPDILLRMAKFYLELNRRAEALESYQKALIIYRQSNNAEREIETLLSIGDTYLLLGRTSQTLQAYQEALDIYKRKQNCIGEDETLDRMARVYEATGQNNSARILYREIAWLRADRTRQCVERK